MRLAYTLASLNLEAVTLLTHKPAARLASDAFDGRLCRARRRNRRCRHRRLSLDLVSAGFSEKTFDRRFYYLPYNCRCYNSFIALAGRIKPASLSIYHLPLNIYRRVRRSNQR